MGSCCCCCWSSSEVELNSSQPFYHHPSEQHEPLSSPHGRASVLPTELLVDTTVGTSIPNTSRSPPAPVLCDDNLRRPLTAPGNREHSGNKNDAPVQPVERTDAGSAFEAKDLKESDNKVQGDIELASLKDKSGELEMSGELKKSEPLVSVQEEEEDVCPTCLEEYDVENPKILTKCQHHFHLSCIYEWMERSDTCPVCNQEMIFYPTIDS